MQQICFDCFPGGRRKALTVSYDDGTIHDRRLVDIFNRHSIRGTFNLNSGRLDTDGFIGSDEVASLYAGHEVAAHSVTHPSLPHLTPERLIYEIVEDRRRLEQLVGYPVRGLAYPGGDFNDAVVEALPLLGIDYARTVVWQPNFTAPQDFLRWGPTCHQSQSLEWTQKFLDVPPLWGLQVLNVMGHSYEYDTGDNWDSAEEFSALAGGRADIWYSTNIEIADYLRALKMVRSSVDGTMLYNPSGLEVWYSDWGNNNTTGSIAAGATVRSHRVGH